MKQIKNKNYARYDSSTPFHLQSRSCHCNAGLEEADSPSRCPLHRLHSDWLHCIPHCTQAHELWQQQQQPGHPLMLFLVSGSLCQGRPPFVHPPGVSCVLWHKLNINIIDHIINNSLRLISLIKCSHRDCTAVVS